MDFFVDSINLCCRMPLTEKGYIKVIDNFDGEQVDWKKFFEEKHKYRKRMQKGDIIPECRGCVFLEEKEWDNEDYVSYINFNNWTTCNQYCIYCNIHELKRKDYNVFPVLKDMVAKKILRKGGHITIAGGEPCVAPEFNDILNLFLENKMSPIRVLTNASIYSEALEMGIQSGQVWMVVSVDSGTRETFYKIKKANFYDRVWGNIDKYASVQPFEDRVRTKFIIIPGINDTKEEIDKWIEMSKSHNIHCLTLDIEVNYFEHYKTKIPSHLTDILHYAINRIEEEKLQLELINRGILLSNNTK